MLESLILKTGLKKEKVAPKFSYRLSIFADETFQEIFGQYYIEKGGCIKN